MSNFAGTRCFELDRGRRWGRGGGLLSGREGAARDPTVCVPKMARPDFPNGKFRFFPRWSLWSGGGGSPPPLLVLSILKTPCTGG